MFLKTWRLITLILAALFMGLEFTHLLELPAKMQYDGKLYGRFRIVYINILAHLVPVQG